MALKHGAPVNAAVSRMDESALCLGPSPRVLRKLERRHAAARSRLSAPSLATGRIWTNGASHGGGKWSCWVGTCACAAAECALASPRRARASL